MTFWSSEYLADALWALYIADRPIILANSVILGASPDGWLTTDEGYVNDPDAGPDRAVDLQSHRPAKAYSGYIPGVAVAAQFRFSIADIVTAFDSIAILGHNFGTCSGSACDVYFDIADDSGFTSGVATLAHWTLAHLSTKRLVSFALNHGPAFYTFTAGTPSGNIDMHTGGWDPSSTVPDHYARATGANSDTAFIQDTVWKRVSNSSVPADAATFIGPTSVIDKRFLFTIETGPTTRSNAFGFVFGWQDSGHFYLIDWRKHKDTLGNDGDEGLRLKVVNSSGTLTANDFFGESGTGVSTIYSNSALWSVSTSYDFTVDFLSGGLIHVLIETGGSTVVEFTVSDTTYGAGTFGFFSNNDYSHTYGPIRTADVTATTDGLDAQVYSGTSHGRIRVEPVGGDTFDDQPYVSEILLGARSQMPCGPDEPWDPAERETALAKFVADSGASTSYVKRKGQRNFDATFTLKDGDEADIVQAAFDYCDQAARKVLWAPAPYSAPEKSLFGDLRANLRMPYEDGPEVRRWQTHFDEVPPFMKAEA